ncbi:hypothetical protein KBZ94_38990 [Streptomyces sp. RM72]|uniref:hypothetical protein n=1 Tax=Streptomyces sp. RM72 TaxID=1115510 RepID=UPI001B389D10|nr:hypothetical protein [Streptomyces sp. RM72]MBQ0890840.1 hypothetical protein [Streptomyces sp. RM72]
MTEAETVEIPSVRCEYLTPGGSDLAAVFETEGHWAFVTLDVVNGTLHTYMAEGKKPPALAGALYVLRWPIAPVTNDRANALLNEIAPRASSVVQRIDLRAPGGVLFPAGLGAALDRIQMACAATWDDPARIVKP